jgi:hypothetical protein
VNAARSSFHGAHEVNQNNGISAPTPDAWKGLPWWGMLRLFCLEFYQPGDVITGKWHTGVSCLLHLDATLARVVRPIMKM